MAGEIVAAGRDALAAALVSFLARPLAGARERVARQRQRPVGIALNRAEETATLAFAREVPADGRKQVVAVETTGLVAVAGDHTRVDVVFHDAGLALLRPQPAYELRRATGEVRVVAVRRLIASLARLLVGHADPRIGRHPEGGGGAGAAGEAPVDTGAAPPTQREPWRHSWERLQDASSGTWPTSRSGQKAKKSTTFGTGEMNSGLCTDTLQRRSRYAAAQASALAASMLMRPWAIAPWTVPSCWRAASVANETQSASVL